MKKGEKSRYAWKGEGEPALFLEDNEDLVALQHTVYIQEPSIYFWDHKKQ